MKEQLITFETAILAKEKGFDEKISTFYYLDPPNRQGEIEYKVDASFFESYNGVSAPTQALLQKWLRERNIDITTDPFSMDDSPEDRVYRCGVWTHDPFDLIFRTAQSGVYEDVLEIGLREALATLPTPSPTCS